MGAAIVVLVAASAALAAKRVTPRATLSNSLASGIHRGGGASGGYVVDLSTGKALFSSAANTPRLPASVEKLYTTSTALLRFGANTSLTTSVLGKGTLAAGGRWSGTLYLKGGGDPTFGSASFDHFAYGGGATIQRLVTNLVRSTGITSIKGRVVGDESYFDSLRGTPATGYGFSTDVEGSLSALVFNRGLINSGTAHVLHPAVFAAQQFVAALKAAHVKIASHTQVGAAVTPASAKKLTLVHSPRMATLVKLTNTPSDNYFAETLIKDLGARFGGGGTTLAGASVVRSEVATSSASTPASTTARGCRAATSPAPATW